MIYPFSVVKVKNGDDVFWAAKSNVLKGVVGQGETAEEAITELTVTEAGWLESALENGDEIPPVPLQELYRSSGKLLLRLASYTHEDAARIAKEQGISLNQYLNDAVVEKNARMASYN